MKRKQFNNVIVGGNGCGKTTLEIEFLIEYAKSNPRKRILLGLPDDSEEKFESIEEIELSEIENFSGIKKIFIEDEKIFFTFLKTYTKKDSEGNYKKFNGLFVGDDLGVVLSRRPTDLYKLFRRRRQCNMDFLWSFHGLNVEVPKGFWGYVNKFILFQTSDNHEYTLDSMPMDKKETFLNLYNEVQQKSATDQYYRNEMIIRQIQ